MFARVGALRGSIAARHNMERTEQYTIGTYNTQSEQWNSIQSTIGTTDTTTGVFLPGHGHKGFLHKLGGGYITTGVFDAYVRVFSHKRYEREDEDGID